MRRTAIALALVVVLLFPAAAGARGSVAKVRVAAVHLAEPRGRQNALLVPVSYPIQLAERRARLTVTLLSGGRKLRRLHLAQRITAGARRVPERRPRFTFVHRVPVGSRVASLARRGLLSARVQVEARLDVDGDGHAEAKRRDRGGGRVHRPGVFGGVCSSSPRRHIRPGTRLVVALPQCDSRRGWALVSRVKHGQVEFRRGKLIYRARRRFRGTQTIELVSLPKLAIGRASNFRPLQFVDVPVTVGTAKGAVVRALGDSVTAGFGYFSNGKQMTIGQLFGCRPAEKEFNDACSSNSLNTSGSKGKVEYAPDYGLSNDVSWAAQWSNEHGITNYANFAISGSEPSNWAPGGEFHSTTERIESEDPDYILMTMGANPLLSNMLFGIDNMGCAIESDITGGYRECIEGAFAEVHLQENLKKLYADLVEHTSATIYLMQYHLSIPSVALAYSATQIAEMGKLLNREIAAVAAQVSPLRLRVVAPPHFNVGIDIRPVYPSHFSCSSFGFKVDGPSVQSTPTQDELEGLHYLSFCKGPAGGGPPWVISGDTGIHPSAAGYAQMASQVPPPGE
jgi:lysophospholipase L1-like esterase